MRRVDKSLRKSHGEIGEEPKSNSTDTRNCSSGSGEVSLDTWNH